MNSILNKGVICNIEPDSRSVTEPFYNQMKLVRLITQETPKSPVIKGEQMHATSI